MRRTSCITILASAALVLSACGDGAPARGGLTDERPDVTFEIVVDGGGVVGGPQKFEVEEGDVVRLSIESDEDDEVHVHGVDVTGDLVDGETTDLTFETGSSGTFEVELHDSGALLGTLEVR